jgi:endonuclease G, mitochondrial
MQKLGSILLVWLLSFAGASQITLSNDAYKVNFSNTFHQPKYVSYYLYKGGGECDRKNFDFKNDKTNLECATDEDYSGKGYDKGHLANAEDFAFDCTKDELTFRYYNCLPQTPNLNRGVWKTNETQVRKWSQTQKLYIICGGYFGSKKMGNVSVPDYCWKVVQSVKTKEVLFCGWFKNAKKASLEEISVGDLEKKLKSKVVLLK